MSQSHATSPISDLCFDPAEAAQAILPVLKDTAESSEKHRCVDPEVNLAFFLGALRWVTGSQKVTWERI